MRMTAPQRRPAPGQRWLDPVALALGLLGAGGELWRTRSQLARYEATPSQLLEIQATPAFGSAQPSLRSMDGRPPHQRVQFSVSGSSPLQTCMRLRRGICQASAAPPRLPALGAGLNGQGGGLCPLRARRQRHGVDRRSPEPPARASSLTGQASKRLMQPAAAPTVPLFCPAPSDYSVANRSQPQAAPWSSPPHSDLLPTPTGTDLARRLRFQPAAR